jgi:hypothetical protein
MPRTNTTALYIVQVGAFRNIDGAKQAVGRLLAVGLAPELELYRDLYRVTVTRVEAPDLRAVITKAGAAGFPEVWLRK